MSRVLLCKPGSDGGLGDCPFTHYAMMTMALTGVMDDVKVMPCSQDDKPAWLLEHHGGSLPCLVSDHVTGAGAVIDSGTIAQFVDGTCGQSKLSSGAANEQAFEVSGPLFGAIAKFIKNTDDSKDEDLAASLDEQLGALEAFLVNQDTPLQFLSGDASPGLADASIAPKLFVLQVAGGHYKNYALDTSKFPSVAEYQARVFALSAFQSTKPRESEVLHGWGQARGGAH